MAEVADESNEPIKHKICVLKASIHCEGCKRKVKKILSQVQGVEFVDVDTKQQRVTVTGSVNADTLIKRLAKSGKHAELWPQQREEKIYQIIRKDKEKEYCDGATKESHEPSTSKVHLDAKTCEGSSKVPPKEVDGGGAAKSNEESRGGGGGGGAGGTAAEAVLGDASVKTSGDVQLEKKSEKNKKKKSEEGCSAAGERDQAAVEKSNGGAGGGGGGGGDGGGGGGEGSTSSSGKKKKKNKGQNGTLAGSAPLSAAPSPPSRVLENQESGPPPPANQSPPRYHHHYPPPHHYYTPPPPTQPVYAVSYNTAYPMSSYTASYYAAPPPPHSYAYMHPGPEAETPLPPSDLDLNPRQPLDSFEIFSDENPNGCFVM